MPSAVQTPSAVDPDNVGELPVLIVGGGPAGLLSAYMLSKLNVPSIIIEKYPQRLAAPKAHALCPRSLEICRQFGLDTGAIRRLGSPRGEAYWVNFLTNLSGERIGVLPYERMDAAVLDATPEMIHNIPQPDFEQLVAAEVADDPNVQLRKGVAYVTSTQTANSVTATVEERETGARSTITARFLLACDGARSAVRKDLGIASEGDDGYETMMTIHFKADLRPVVGDRVGMLHWITDPACSGFIIAYDLGGNQVLISNFDSWDEALCRRVVTAAVGQDIPFTVLSHRPWLLSRKVAEQYSEGNIFLVGDAAHSFPPTGGLGLNSGLADAHNLVYKIAAVYHGTGGAALLDSYGADRRPIALINSAQSLKNGHKIFSFLKALGTAGIDDVDAARAMLHESIHDPAKQFMIAREVEGQREHFDNLEIHIGYVYGDPRPPSHASHFTPKFIPGARLPHAWIALRGAGPSLLGGLPPIDVAYVRDLAPAEVAARRFSTLDLCRCDAFTLVASAAAADRWRAVVAEVDADADAARSAPLHLCVAGVDFDFGFPAQQALFDGPGGLAAGAALLVRPDQHILASCPAATTAATLRATMAAHMGL